eukprot:GHVU01115672.1.p2 GENE.GHVU01115672.1~~GHVU01115672.1.p2  ORF type:complete len:123 (+),score=30.89 GHVU01115672.1:398-766(+)
MGRRREEEEDEKKREREGDKDATNDRDMQIVRERGEVPSQVFDATRLVYIYTCLGVIYEADRDEQRGATRSNEEQRGAKRCKEEQRGAKRSNEEQRGAKRSKEEQARLLPSFLLHNLRCARR